MLPLPIPKCHTVSHCATAMQAAPTHSRTQHSLSLPATPPPFCSSTLVNYINEWQLVPQAVLHTWAGTELTQPSATRSWWAVSQHGGAGVEHPACPQLCLWGGLLALSFTKTEDKVHFSTNWEPLKAIQVGSALGFAARCTPCIPEGRTPQPTPTQQRVRTAPYLSLPGQPSPHKPTQSWGGDPGKEMCGCALPRGSAGRISGADVVLLEERGEQLCAEAGTCQSWIFAFLGSELLANGSGLGSGAAGFLMGMDGCGEEERGLTEQIGDASPRMGVCPEVIYV